jgi:hypothetical protein
MIQGFSGGLLNRQLIYQTDLPSFQRDFASLKTLDHGTGPAITFTRASGATFFDADGVLQTAANDAPRFDHDPVTGSSRGLLIEEARTNSLRNSEGGGSANGVIGSGGVVPTNWSIFGVAGTTTEIVASGTSGGFSYIDIKLSGTNTTGAAASFAINPESITQVVAASGQQWTASIYLAIVGGSFSGLASATYRVVERNISGTALATASASITDITSSFTRKSAARTFTEATVERAHAQLSLTMDIGETIDLTLRIAAPQLEQGAFPTSYIPTTTAAATRATETAVVAPVSGLYNGQEFTILSEASTNSLVKNQGVWGFGDATKPFATRSGFYLAISDMSGNTSLSHAIDGNAQVNGTTIIGGSYVAGTPMKVIYAAAKNNSVGARSGTLGTVDTICDIPTGPTGLSIGSLDQAWTDGGNRLNGYVRKIAYWPKRLTNTLLEQLTT